MNLNSRCRQRPAFPRGVPADELECRFAAGHKGDHSWVPIVRAQPTIFRMPTEAEMDLQHQMHEARKLK